MIFKMKSCTDKAQIRFENEKLAPQPGLLLTSFKLWDGFLVNIQDLGLDITKILQVVGGQVGRMPFKTSSSVLPQVVPGLQKTFSHMYKSFNFLLNLTSPQWGTYPPLGYSKPWRNFTPPP